MNTLLLCALGVFWLLRIAALIRRKRALAGADLMAENLARILAGQLARGVSAAEAIADANGEWSDKRTRSTLRAVKRRVALGQKAGTALPASTTRFASDPAIRQLIWRFRLVDEYGAPASMLSEFADSVADERRVRRELRNQLLEARTTAIALPLVAMVMGCSLLSANRASVSVLASGFGSALVAGAGAVVALGVAIVLRVTKI
jgi:hypothetical protein